MITKKKAAPTQICFRIVVCGGVICLFVKFIGIISSFSRLPPHPPLLCIGSGGLEQADELREMGTSPENVSDVFAISFVTNGSWKW
jgi:hypothetical protein